MYIRCHSWGRGDLSWSRVQERLLFASQQLGHNPVFISTNGYQNMQYWTEEKSRQVRELHKKEMAGQPYDIDITYAIPWHFKHRFLKDSKVTIGRFDYESSILPKGIAKFINDADYIVGSSDFVCNIFANAGTKPEKLRKIQSGIDQDVFNMSVPPLNRSKLGASDDTHIFLAVAEPHYRKQLDRLLDIYGARFTKNDNVLLIIKTKLVDPSTKMGFEQDLRPILAGVKAKYGDNMPKVQVIPGHVPSLAGLYRTADTFVLPTVGEGWGMPFLEAMACGNIVIAPEYGGQLDFLNADNSLLCPITMRKALAQEQYCASGDLNDPNDLAVFADMPAGLVGAPKEDIFGDMMVECYKNGKAIKDRLMPAMIETANKFTWERAARQMLELAK